MILWITMFWVAVAVLFYANIGYPILMSILARFHKEPNDVVRPLPKVTLIIPAYNEEVVLDAKLRNALELDYPSDELEILVGSDASTDRTVEIARRYESPGLRVLAFPERRGKPSVVNDAVRMATGQVLFLCDANVMFYPTALRRLVARLADERVGAVTGDVRLASHDANFGEGESCYYSLERRIQEGESHFGSVVAVDGGMYIMRRHLFQPLPVDALNEDYTNTMRVINQGYRVVYEPSAIASENATPTARQEFKRRMRLSAGSMGALKRGEWPTLRRPIEFWQFVSHKLLRWFAPIFLLFLLVSNIALVNHAAIYRVALVLQSAVYLCFGIAAVSVRLRATKIGGICFYFVMSHIAMLVGIVRGFVRMPQITWTKPDRAVCEDQSSESAT